MKYGVLVTLFLMLLSSSACSNPYRRQCSKWLPLFHGPSKEWDQEFRKHDLETQCEIYFCAMNYVHPPLMGFSERLAQAGPNVVPLLQRELRETTDELVIEDVVLAFVVMQTRGFYDVASDGNLMKAIEESAQRIRFAARRDIVLQNIERIRTTPAPTTPTKENPAPKR